MPTIEIVSANSTGLDLTKADFDVAIIEENTAISHRGLFSENILQKNGTIIHIGNPDFKHDKEGGFFAGHLINWEFRPNNKIIAIVDPSEAEYDSLNSQQFQFQFNEEFRKDILKLMELALEGSPIKKIYFLTDY